LAIHNYAIIRDLEIDFHGGFNVLSGETGAGKSILVGAVNLILGARASSEMIRTGAAEASVEAVMQLKPSECPCALRLSQWGIEFGPELVIRRSIAKSGLSVPDADAVVHLTYGHVNYIMVEHSSNRAIYDA